MRYGESKVTHGTVDVGDKVFLRTCGSYGNPGGWAEETIVKISKAEAKTDKGTRIKLQYGTVVGGRGSGWGTHIEAVRDTPETRADVESRIEEQRLSGIAHSFSRKLETAAQRLRKVPSDYLPSVASHIEHADQMTALMLHLEDIENNKGKA